MKNLYNRLTKAPVDVPVTFKAGSNLKGSSYADTPTGCTVSKNQHSKKPSLLQKVATVVVLLLFVFIAGITKVNAQSTISPANGSWWKLKEGEPTGPGTAGITAGKIVFDATGNAYVINRIGSTFYLTRRQTSGIIDTTWLNLGSTGTGYTFTINEVDIPLFYNCMVLKPSDNNLYILWTRVSTPMGQTTDFLKDSVFVGQVSNLNGTPIFTKRWKAIANDNYTSWSSGIPSQTVKQLHLDNTGNMYVILEKTIVKIADNGTVTAPFCTPFVSNLLATTEMVSDNNGNLYVARSRKVGISTTTTDQYITKINTAGVADTTWFKVTNDTMYNNRPIKIAYSNGFIYAAHLGQKPGYDSVRISKIDVASGTGAVFKSLRYPYLYIFRQLSDIVSDNTNNIYITEEGAGTVHRIYNGVELDSAWLNFSNPTNTGTGYMSVSPSNQVYMGPRVQLPPGMPMPGFPVNRTTYYSKLVGAFSVSISSQNATCAGINDGTAKAVANGCTAGSYTYLWTPGNFTTDSIGGLAPGTYNVRVICSGDTVNKSVVIAAGSGPAAPSASNQSLCSGATVADLVATPSSGNTIVWYATATGGTALANSTPLVNATKYYAAQVTPSNCESSIRAVDSVTIQATVAAKADSSYCNGSNIAVNFVGASGNTYAWTATQNGTGITASGTGNTSFTGVNNTNAVVTDTVIVSSSFNTCTPQKDTFAISVLPTPKVDSIANILVCPGSSVTAINFTTPIIPIGIGSTVGYKWANNNTAIGLAANGFGNIPSFTAGASVQTCTITVTPYMLKSATDTCFGTVRTFNIAADLPAAPTTTGNLVVYTGTKTISQLAVTPLTGGTLNYFYQATGGTALAGSTIVVDDTTYYVTQTVAGCESSPRKQIKVNRIAADSIVLCSPATVGSLIATPTTGSSAKWYDVTSGGTALANTAALGVGQDTLYVEEGNPSAQLSLHSYSPTDLSYAINGLTVGENDTIYYGTFGDNAKIIRINPDGSNPTIITSGGPGENIRYVQYESDASGRYILYTTQNTVKRLNLNTGVITTIWTSPTPASFNLREFSRDVANNKLYVADTEFGRIKLVDLANNTAVTIDSLPYKQFGTSSFPRRPFAVCYVAPNSLYIGDFTNGLVFKKDLTTGIRTDSISYPSITDIRLLSNGKLMIIGGDKISTINQDLTGRTDIVTSLISGGYAEFNSQGELVFKDYLTIKKLSSIQSNRVPVTVIVNPKPIVTATIDKVVCNNSTVAAVNFSTTTTGGTVTYAWTNNKTSIGLAASGTGNIASFTAVNNGTVPDTATIIVTPTITNGGTSCAGIKDTFLIVVNPTAVVNTVSNQVVCNAAAVTAINFGTTNTGGTVTYAWTNSTTSIGLAASGNGNIATFNGVNNGTAPVTATIIVTPTFTNGGVSCAGTSQTFTITVNPTANINALNDHVLCNGANFTEVVPTTTATGGTVTYAWTNNTTSIGLAASGTGNVPAFTTVNNGTAPVTATVIVTPTFANGGVNCTGTADTFYITVNPTAKIDAITNKVACNGATVAAVTPTTTATGGTVTYAWTNDNATIGLAASGTGTIPAFTAINNGTAPVTATITVTPTFNNGGLSCTGTVRTYTITINPTATVNTVSNQVVCNGSAATAVNFGTMQQAVQ